MKTWYVEFKGREVGAIGIRSNYAVTVEAETPKEALLKVYDTHDHLSHLHITDQSTGYTYAGFDFKQVG